MLVVKEALQEAKIVVEHDECFAAPEPGCLSRLSYQGLLLVDEQQSSWMTESIIIDLASAGQTSIVRALLEDHDISDLSISERIKVARSIEDRGMLLDLSEEAAAEQDAVIRDELLGLIIDAMEMAEMPEAAAVRSKLADQEFVYLGLADQQIRQGNIAAAMDTMMVIRNPDIRQMVAAQLVHWNVAAGEIDKARTLLAQIEDGFILSLASIRIGVASGDTEGVEKVAASVKDMNDYERDSILASAAEAMAQMGQLGKASDMLGNGTSFSLKDAQLNIVKILAFAGNFEGAKSWENKIEDPWMREISKAEIAAALAVHLDTETALDGFLNTETASEQFMQFHGTSDPHEARCKLATILANTGETAAASDMLEEVEIGEVCYPAALATLAAAVAKAQREDFRSGQH